MLKCRNNLTNLLEDALICHDVSDRRSVPHQSKMSFFGHGNPLASQVGQLIGKILVNQM